jgi:hypothetical protein
MNDFTKIEGECVLRDARDERYLGHISSSYSDPEQSKYFVGQIIPLPDSLLYQNNSARIRNCFVTKLGFDKIFSLPVIYLNVSKGEAQIDGRVDGRNFSAKRVNGVDWSGGEGWLSL